MKRILCALIALSAAAPAVTSAAHAGQVTQIAQNQRCVETLRAGDALLKGIHTGALPHHVFIKRCDTLWMALEIKGGAETIRPIEGRYIPKFKARSKPQAFRHPRRARHGGQAQYSGSLADAPDAAL